MQPPEKKSRLSDPEWGDDELDVLLSQKERLQEIDLLIASQTVPLVGNIIDNQRKNEFLIPLNPPLTKNVIVSSNNFNIGMNNQSLNDDKLKQLQSNLLIKDNQIKNLSSTIEQLEMKLKTQCIDLSRQSMQLKVELGKQKQTLSNEIETLKTKLHFEELENKSNKYRYSELAFSQSKNNIIRVVKASEQNNFKSIDDNQLRNIKDEGVQVSLISDTVNNKLKFKISKMKKNLSIEKNKPDIVMPSITLPCDLLQIIQKLNTSIEQINFLDNNKFKKDVISNSSKIYTKKTTNTLNISSTFSSITQNLTSILMQLRRYQKQIFMYEPSLNNQNIFNKLTSVMDTLTILLKLIFNLKNYSLNDFINIIYIIINIFIGFPNQFILKKELLDLFTFDIIEKIFTFDNINLIVLIYDFFIKYISNSNVLLGICTNDENCIYILLYSFQPCFSKNALEIAISKLTIFEKILVKGNNASQCIHGTYRCHTMILKETMDILSSAVDCQDFDNDIKLFLCRKSFTVIYLLLLLDRDYFLNYFDQNKCQQPIFMLAQDLFTSAQYPLCDSEAQYVSHLCNILQLSS